MFVIFSLFIQNFFSAGNLNNVLRQAAMLSLVAVGQVFVILLGGIDLSQGSVLGLTGVVIAILLNNDVSLPMSLLLSLLMAISLGLLSGYLIAYLKVPKFVATFGMSGIALGLALVISDSRVIWGFPEAVRRLHDGEFLGLSSVFYVIGIVYLVAFWVLKYTSFGSSVYAIGGNQTSAELSGIRTKRNEMLCYAISTGCAGLAGIMAVSRLNSARAIMGAGYEFEAIAAVILGGTRRLGGKGGAPQTLVGVLIVATVRNGLNLVGVSVYMQLVAIGLVLIIVYIFNENSISIKKTAKKLLRRRTLNHA
jgi:ribose transport system permease protein